MVLMLTLAEVDYWWTLFTCSLVSFDRLMFRRRELTKVVVGEVVVVVTVVVADVLAVVDVVEVRQIWWMCSGRCLSWVILQCTVCIDRDRSCK